MPFLQCPNAACGSHGPFEVTNVSGGNGDAPHRVLQCPLCNTVLAVLEPNQHLKVPEEYERSLMRLETSVRAIQSNLSHLRSQFAALQGRISRRI